MGPIDRNEESNKTDRQQETIHWVPRGMDAPLLENVFIKEPVDFFLRRERLTVPRV